MNELRIAHLYPRELGINGDSGNVLALRRRLEWRSLSSVVIEVDLGDAMPTDVDIVVIGSGPHGARDAVLPDALRHASAVNGYLSEGGALLAVGTGMHLLGREFTDHDGVVRQGLGVLPISVVAAEKRRVGEALGTERAATIDQPVLRLAGFVNHGVEVQLHDEAQPLTELERGWGNVRAASEETTVAEGVRVAHAVGTHLHGPVLPMNPSIADELLSAALHRRGSQLPPSDDRVRHADEMARQSRAAIATRLGRSGVVV